MKEKTFSRTLFAMLAIGIVATALSQPSKLAWVRSNLSTDIVMDVACDVIVDSQGRFVTAGASKQPDGTYKGCITIFNRNRSIADVVEVARPGGGDLMFHFIRQVGNTFYVAANGRAAGAPAHNELRFMRFDSGLNQVGGIATRVNTTGGLAEPTDLEVAPDGNAYVCGTFRTNTSEWTSFLHRVAPATDQFSLNFEEIKLGVRTEPHVEVNGIIAILIGLLVPEGPAVHSYSPAGTLNWSFGASQGGSFLMSSALCTNENLQEVYFATGEGMMANDIDGVVRRINKNTGQVTGIYTCNPGQGIVSPRDVASGQATGRSGRALFSFEAAGDAAPVPALLSIDPIANQSFTKLMSMNMQFLGGLFVDQYAEAGFSVARPGATGLFTKVSSTDVPRFSWGLSQTGFLLPYIEQDAVYETNSGDIAILQEDGQRFSLTCIQQAPVGKSDYFQPKSGKFFRSTPVTLNDRFAGGASISIVQQPSHGSVSMGANGIFNYTSAQGFVGLDSFRYQLTKPGLNPSVVTVNLNVKP